MGAAAKRPISNAPGAGGSGFYQNALNQQKEAVANRPTTQGTPGTLPSNFSREDDAAARAYDQYMQQQRQYMNPDAKVKADQQRMADLVQQKQEYEMGRRQPTERPPSSPNGITMGAGYSNRPFD